MSDHEHDHDAPMSGDESSRESTSSASSEAHGREEHQPVHNDAHDNSHDVEPAYDVAGAALDALSPDEEADLLAAAAEDPALAAELAGLSNVAAELARLAPTHAINRGRSAGMRSRLLARAAATQTGRPARVTQEGERAAARDARVAPRLIKPAQSPTPPHAPAPRTTGTQRAVPYEPPTWHRSGHALRWAAVAAAILVAGAGIYAVSHLTVAPGNTASTVASRDSVLGSEVAALRAELVRKDSIIGALTGMHTRVIDLVSYPSAEPMARMFWNQQTQQWTMYASHVKQPPPGKTYQLWIMARGHPQPISAGTFMPDQSGAAVMTTKYALEPGSLRRIAITEEPDGGMPAPTGPVMFAGAGQ